MTRPARPQPKTDRTAPRPSVLAHPVFPVMAAIWFGGLFGLGALAASGNALAALVGHLHVAAILPAAAPPLGTTAHVLIAIGLAGLGAGFGLAGGLVLYARAGGGPLFDFTRVNASVIRTRPVKTRPVPRAASEDFAGAGRPTPTPRVRNRDAHPDAPPRRPLVVTEDVLPYHAPISHAPISVVEPAPGPAGAAVVAAVASVEPIVEPITVPPSWTATEFGTGFSEGMGHDHGDAPFGAFMTAHPASQFVAPDAEVPPFFAGTFGDVPPLAPSAAYDAGEPIVLPPVAGPQDSPVGHAEPTFQAGPMPLASQATVAPQVPIVDVPVASLGLVQLIERLALAITVRQAHRAALVSGVVPIAAPAPGPGPVTDDAGPLLRAKPSRLVRFGEAADTDDGDHAFTQAPSINHGAAPVQLHDPLARVDAASHDWVDAADDALPPRYLGGQAEYRPATTTMPDAMMPDTTVSDTRVFEATVVAPQDTFVTSHGAIAAPKDTAGVETRYSSLANIAVMRPDLAPLATAGSAPDAVHQNGPVVHFPFTQSAFTAPRLPVVDTAAATAGDSAAPAPMRAPTDQADRALRDALATLRRMSAQR